jgi:hypothetical protein
MNDELEVLQRELQHVRGTLPSRIDVDVEGVEQGLAQLMLTLVEFPAPIVGTPGCAPHGGRQPQ